MWALHNARDTVSENSDDKHKFPENELILKPSCQLCREKRKRKKEVPCAGKFVEVYKIVLPPANQLGQSQESNANMQKNWQRKPHRRKTVKEWTTRVRGGVAKKYLKVGGRGNGVLRHASSWISYDEKCLM
jgi:hypothetical protein